GAALSKAGTLDEKIAREPDLETVEAGQRNRERPEPHPSGGGSCGDRCNRAAGADGTNAGNAAGGGDEAERDAVPTARLPDDRRTERSERRRPRGCIAERTRHGQRGRELDPARQP